MVIRERHPGWKFCTPYEKEQWKVISVNGTMIMVQKGQSQLTRKVTWFKRVTFGQGEPGEDHDVQDSSLMDSHTQPAPMRMVSGKGATAQKVGKAPPQRTESLARGHRKDSSKGRHNQ